MPSSETDWAGWAGPPLWSLYLYPISNVSYHPFPHHYLPALSSFPLPLPLPCLPSACYALLPCPAPMPCSSYLPCLPFVLPYMPYALHGWFGFGIDRTTCILSSTACNNSMPLLSMPACKTSLLCLYILSLSLLQTTKCHVTWWLQHGLWLYVGVVMGRRRQW